MRILIVEDEPPIARYIEQCTRSLLKTLIRRLDTVYSLEEAFEYLQRKSIDLCLLDLNLSGSDGYELLKQVMAMPYRCIIISAHTEKAVTAFEYGVVDFVPKPFTPERLQMAFDRYLGSGQGPSPVKYLVHRRGSGNHLLALEEVVYFKAVRVFVEAFLQNGGQVLLEKHLNQLERILPDSFLRIHRSYMVNIHHIEQYGYSGETGYRMRLKDGTVLPVSRYRYRALRDHLGK